METVLDRKTRIWIKLMKAGALSGCHQRYDRSFHLGKYQFPVCARCTGLFCGQACGFLISERICKSGDRQSILFHVLFVSALAADGVGQHLGFWESTNKRRFITGILCGYSAASVTCGLIRKIKEFF